MSPFGIVLVPTITAALHGEKTLKRADLDCKLIPVPRELSSNCGVSLRFRWEDVDEVKQRLVDAHVDTDGVHRLVGSGG